MSEKKEYNYGKEKRMISFEDKDGNFARLIVKLRHEGLSRAEFFRAITLAFIEDNDLIDDFVLKYKMKKESFRKNRQKILNKERRDSKESVKRYGLDPDEIEDIFDIIEEEMNL